MDTDRKEELHEKFDLPYEFLDKLADNPRQRFEYDDMEYSWLDDHDVMIRFDGNRYYRINNVDFDSFEDVLAIKKSNPDYTLDDAYEQYNEELSFPFRETKEHIKEAWDSVEPLTEKDIKEKYPLNGEHFDPNKAKRKVAFDFINKNL